METETKQSKTETEQLADPQRPGTPESLGSPVAPPLPSRARMLGTNLRAQPWSWQTRSRYQRLGAKATTRPGSPGRALDKLHPPRLVTLILPNSHGTFPLHRKPQGGPSGQDWGCWTLRVDLTPPLPLPQWPRAYQGVGCTCSQLPSGLSQEPAHGEDHSGLPECPQAFAYRAPQPGVPPPPTLPSTNVEPSAWPHEMVQIHCYHSPAPVASSQGSLSHGSLSGGFWGSVPVPTSSAYTLLWARGWCTKPLINALETQQGAEGE